MVGGFIVATILFLYRLLPTFKPPIPHSNRLFLTHSLLRLIPAAFSTWAILTLEICRFACSNAIDSSSLPSLFAVFPNVLTAPALPSTNVIRHVSRLVVTSKDDGLGSKCLCLTKRMRDGD